jgi:mannose-1-phosphate guanylyltransferase
MMVWGTQSRSALILAGGDGRRLRPLTRQIVGDDRPKQFCPVLGGETLLEQTRRRVAKFAPADRVLIVVVGAHERFYAPLLTDVPPRCVVIQPENRGTAPAILYGLLRLTTMTPVGPVALFPSDHYVSNDAAFIAHVEAAAEAVRARPDLVVLLGITPDTAEVEYGWIELGDPLSDLGVWTLYRVLDFWEKPSPVLGEALRARGCLWNSFVIVAYPSTLIALCRQALPSVVDEFLRIRPALTASCERTSMRQLYAYLPSLDFSRNVLASRPPSLAVLPVTGVAWCDLGEPRRVAATRAYLSAAPPGRGGAMSA